MFSFVPYNIFSIKKVKIWCHSVKMKMQQTDFCNLLCATLTSAWWKLHTTICIRFNFSWIDNDLKVLSASKTSSDNSEPEILPKRADKVLRCSLFLLPFYLENQILFIFLHHHNNKEIGEFIYSLLYNSFCNQYQTFHMSVIWTDSAILKMAVKWQCLYIYI